MLSGNYINQNGLMNNTFYRRYTARINTTYNISKVFSVGENLMIAQWNDRGYGTGDDRGIPYTVRSAVPKSVFAKGMTTSGETNWPR
jgi:hypothetical protein